MAWVFNSKRMRGSRSDAPHVNFYIGTVLIARIVMRGQPWRYFLIIESDDGPTSTEHASFSDGLKELHKRLNAQPPDDHTVP